MTDTTEVRPRISSAGTDKRPHTAARRRSSWHRASKWLFIAPAAVYVLAFFAYPLVQNVAMSFQDYTASSFFTGEAPFVGFANYLEVASSPIFGKVMANTFIFTFASIAGQFVIGMAFALFFQKHFPLSGLLRSLLLLPWLLPLLVSSAVWKWMLDQDSGVINQVLGAAFGVPDNVPWLTNPTMALVSVIIVNIWIGIPFHATILYGGLQAIPEEIYEAAALDGSTGISAFKNVTWPLMKPVIGVVLVLAVVYTLKVLDVILGVTNGGPANATDTISTQAYFLSFREFEFGLGSAASNILVLISLVFALIYLRENRRELHS